MSGSSCLHFIRVCWLPVAVSLTACSDRQEKARAALHVQRHDFSVDDFFAAAKAGKLEVIKEFLDAGMNPDAADGTGATALIAAAENGHGHIVRELLGRKADKNFARPDGDTALIAAARGGDAEAVRVLVEAGAAVDVKNARQLTALAEASLAGNAAAVELLAPKSPQSLDYALQLAAVKGRTEVIDALIKAGASVLARSSENRTPLMYAASYGQETAVRLLLERGSNRLAVDNELNTSAMLAEAHGHPTIAALLNEPPAETTQEVAEGTPAATGVFGAVVNTGSDASRPAQLPSVPKPVRMAGVALPLPQGAGAEAVKSALKLERYQERQLPVLLRDVSEGDGRAQVQVLSGPKAGLVEVAPGQTIPGTDIDVVSVQRRFIHAKGGKGNLVNVSTMWVRDSATREPMLAQRNQPVCSADTCGILSDKLQGLRYEVRQGDVFKAGDETFKVIDVRPTQVVLEGRHSGETVVITRQ